MAKRQIVGVVSQKGGVGKSTLCQLIAREAAAGGKQAKILDFDTKQMTSTEWVRARLERDVEPTVQAEPVRNIDKALKQNRGYDIVVLDGAPGSPKRTACPESRSAATITSRLPSRRKSSVRDFRRKIFST